MAWLSVKRTAELLALTERAVQLSAEKNRFVSRYIPGIGRGGRVLEILLESLPVEAQARYRGEQEQDRQEGLMSLTGKRRNGALALSLIVDDYFKFKAEYPGADKQRAFLEYYNTKHPDKQITKNQLSRWARDYKRDGCVGLADMRGGHNRGQSTIPEDVWKAFLGMWAKQSQPTAKSCYRRVCEMFPGREIPSYATFTYRLEKLEKPFRVLAREGEKAYEDKCLPFNVTDYTDLYSNQEWISDHHVFDVLCEDESGRVFRPWGCFWEDRKSRRIINYAISKNDPNSDLILSSFAGACRKCGIPDGVKLDNGKDYKVYDLFSTDFPLSVCNQMGIKVVHARPYNAKAKPIERFFGTLEGECKHLDSYIGNSPKARPERMNAVNAKLQKEGKVMPYQDFLNWLTGTVKAYNDRPHSGQGMDGRTPNEVYKGSFTKPMRVVKDTDVLNLFLMRVTKPLIVGRSGVRIPQTGYYYDDSKLYAYQGQKVYANYDINDVRKVFVFNEHNEYICTAKCKELCTLDTAVSMEAIRANDKLKAKRRKQERARLRDLNVPTIEETIAQATEDDEEEFTDVLPMVNSTKHKQSKDIKRQEAKEAREASLRLVCNKKNGRDLDAELYQYLKTLGGK